MEIGFAKNIQTLIGAEFKIYLEHSAIYLLTFHAYYVSILIKISHLDKLLLNT